MQAGNFPKINKRAGCNKAMQVGIFQKSIVKKLSWLENFQDVKDHAGWKISKNY